MKILTIASLTLNAITACWLVWRYWRRRRPVECELPEPPVIRPDGDWHRFAGMDDDIDDAPEELAGRMPV